ncbi:hypothetical protein Gotur_014620 [Gossypium turneri]
MIFRVLRASFLALHNTLVLHHAILLLTHLLELGCHRSPPQDKFKALKSFVTGRTREVGECLLSLDKHGNLDILPNVLLVALLTDHDKSTCSMLTQKHPQTPVSYASPIPNWNTDLVYLLAIFSVLNYEPSSVIIPNQLQVHTPDYSLFSFGSFGPAIGSAFSGPFAPGPLKNNLDESPEAADISCGIECFALMDCHYE